MRTGFLAVMSDIYVPRPIVYIAKCANAGNLGNWAMFAYFIIELHASVTEIQLTLIRLEMQIFNCERGYWLK